MKFKLTTSGYRYSKEEKEKLEKFGLKFEYYSGVDSSPIYRILCDFGTIEINSLEELMLFCAEWGGYLVLSQECIEIYDGYRE